MKGIIMKINTAFNTLSGVEFVSWAIKNGYDYFIKTGGNNESGWVWSKGSNPRQYKFNHNIK
jgi:hypothetical protein